MTESNRESDGILPLYKKGVGGVIRLAARRARAGDLGRRAGRATCAVGGQRTPLPDHEDKIVDFCHLKADSCRFYA